MDVGSSELCSKIQMKLLRRGRRGAPVGAPVAERKRKTAGGKIHLEPEDTRAGSSLQLRVKNVEN